MRIPSSDIDHVWHSKYHDGPLSGLCRQDGQLCWFENDHASDEYELTPLKGLAKLRAVASWRWFEFCVGTHCSYPRGKTAMQRRGRWFWRRLGNLYYGRKIF